MRTFVGNAPGGLRGGANLASWVVAGTLAYFLWVKPAQDLKKEQEVLSFSYRLPLYSGLLPKSADVLVFSFSTFQVLTRKSG
ncbi:hypothetical protein BHM03_00039768 [Ensete ventricosum]|nr:hypothetical protein BHM03_00039768 [Ensete ventricosum]